MKKTIVLRISIKPECIARVLEASKDLVAQTRQEPGCIFYNFYQSTENPSDFIFYEKFQNQEAIQKHNETDYVKKFLLTVKESSQIDVEMELFD
ncbi:putative quinol monooxygenase [Flavobacterium sp. NKUCC04_CG]|uniref:putative quinol monooxygenase n=1 Tax=Flavobacterium sp. NKUCC04_CG TaxID=2842121 RepID=UPI001C5AD1C6|nr:putative quinol monooxygenase [Flavobacterium sp. NKUCC04_CG]MBW3518773.1 antibiotic biosynthesis monooxygenase [Flavobacterium sp. NKUCC04_CG]